MKASEIANHTLVGLHIPKCAGTSMLQLFEQAFERHQIYQNTSVRRNWIQQRPEFLEIRDHGQLRIVWGHSIHEEMLKLVRSPMLITGLREPRERIRSHFAYESRLAVRQGSEPVSAEVYLADRGNPMCRNIVQRFPTLAGRDGPGTLSEKARRALSHFSLVYFAENFENSTRRLLSALGVVNTAVRANVSPSPHEPLNIPDEYITHDLELYEWARETFDAQPRPPSQEVRSFSTCAVNRELLETFLYKRMVNEYQSWNMLDDVLEAKRDALTRLRRDLEVLAAR